MEYELLENEPEVAGLSFTTLREIVEPLGFTVTSFQYDPGLVVTLRNPEGRTVRASADYGDWYGAPGLAVAMANARGWLPSIVLESIIGTSEE